MYLFAEVPVRPRGELIRLRSIPFDDRSKQGSSKSARRTFGCRRGWEGVWVLMNWRNSVRPRTKTVLTCAALQEEDAYVVTDELMELSLENWSQCDCGVHEAG